MIGAAAHPAPSEPGKACSESTEASAAKGDVTFPSPAVLADDSPGSLGAEIAPARQDAAWRRDHQRADGSYDAEMWGDAASVQADAALIREALVAAAAQWPATHGDKLAMFDRLVAALPGTAE